MRDGTSFTGNVSINLRHATQLHVHVDKTSTTINTGSRVITFKQTWHKQGVAGTVSANTHTHIVSVLKNLDTFTQVIN